MCSPRGIWYDSGETEEKSQDTLYMSGKINPVPVGEINCCCCCRKEGRSLQGREKGVVALRQGRERERERVRYDYKGK